jgi:hypothetical protein
MKGNKNNVVRHITFMHTYVSHGSAMSKCRVLLGIAGIDSHLIRTKWIFVGSFGLHGSLLNLFYASELHKRTSSIQHTTPCHHATTDMRQVD